MTFQSSVDWDTPPYPAMPDWIAGARPDGVEAAAGLAVAALAALHPWLADAKGVVPGRLLRDRLALAAAERCLGRWGRVERAGELRDAVHLLRPGEAAGPAGEVFQKWRGSVRAPCGKARPTGGPELVLGGSKGTMEDEIALLISQDMALARSLGWAHPVPLFALGVARADLARSGEARRLAGYEAVRRAACEALALARDLTRRAGRLKMAEAKLRAKGAGAAVRLFLEEDAVSPSISLTPVIRGSDARMTDRAARRLCERLVSLGVARELTGRPSFRLYGL